MLDLNSLEKVVKISDKGHKRICYVINCGCCNARVEKSKQRLDNRTLHFCSKCSATKNSYCKKQYKQDPIFFLRDKLEVYYSAGFIAADGNVDKNQSMLQIKIHQSDKIILEKIKEYSSATNPIHIYDDTGMCSLRLNNYFWLQDLSSKFNIVPNKTLILQPPNFNLKTTSPELIKSYLVGYIDGDGCIMRRKKCNTLVLDIVGSKGIIDWFGKCFTYYYGTEIPPKAIRLTGKNKRVSKIVLVGSKAQTILNDLKQLPIYKLERKWSKV